MASLLRRRGDGGASPAEGRRRSPGTAVPWLAFAGGGLVVAANVLAISGYRLPFAGPAIAFWFLVVQPAYLIFTSSVWRGCSAAERAGYSLGATLLLLMLTGLLISTFLPYVGVPRALSTLPIAVCADIITVALYLFRRRRPAPVPWRSQLKALTRVEARLIGAAGMSVLLAVLGANRLNNGAGDTVSLLALGCMTGTIVVLFALAQRVRDVVVNLVVYLTSLALLLMTSLRGWFVTGHDIQLEYRVFQLTQAHGHWSMAYYHDAYTACLSITILPTEIAQITHVADPYVYKFFFQLLFALCPVLVYAIARRFWPVWISLLSAVYFVGFPTFFTDMPFLNRQEVGFLFLCAGFLAITSTQWSRRRRQLTFFAAALGVEISHYSTMYILLGVLLFAWGAYLLTRLNPVRLRRRRLMPGADSWSSTTQTVGIGSILVVVAIAAAWGQLVTQTSSQAVTTAESAIAGLMGANGARSGDVAYSLFGPATPSPQTVLDEYNAHALQLRANSPPLTFVPAPNGTQFTTPVASSVAPLPVTGLGRFVTGIGIPVGTLNSAVRNGAAKDEQLFIVVGMIAIFFSGKLRKSMSREVFYLCVGSTAMLGVITVLPNLSVDYGVLRAFQEALILLGPVLVAGSVTTFSLLGGAWPARLASAVGVTIFVSTTGLLPQLLGGYPPQLSLNNRGSYYDIYYTHPQEIAAVDWLATQPNVVRQGVQASFDQFRFAFESPSTVSGSQYMSDIYPPLIHPYSWVMVSYATLHTGDATAAYNGNLVQYSYPLGLLGEVKNLVYDNGGAEIYR